MNLHHWRDLFHSGLMPLRLWEVKLGCEILVAYTKWKIRDVLRVYRHTPLLASTQWNLLFLFSKTLIIKNYQLFFKELVFLPLLYCFLACFHFPSTSFIILNISLLLLCSWTIHSEACTFFYGVRYCVRSKERDVSRFGLKGGTLSENVSEVLLIFLLSDPEAD